MFNPHILSDNLENEEETFSFLPQKSLSPPINQITITSEDDRIGRRRGTRRRKTKGKQKDAFCTSWMIRSISLMMIGTFLVILFKTNDWDLSSQHDAEKEVLKWRDMKLSDIKHWCLDVSPAIVFFVSNHVIEGLHD